MLETIQQFITTNLNLILFALACVVVIVGLMMYRRSQSGNYANISNPVPTPSHDLEGLDNVNMVCDLANGVCMPQQSDHQITGEHQMQMPDEHQMQTEHQMQMPPEHQMPGEHQIQHQM
jgi:hypothetical protein